MLIKFLYLGFAYLCGSIPFAYIIAKAVKGVDIRAVGSGNLGTTNVFRSIGVGSAIAVFILDLLKGFLPVSLAIFINGSFSYSVAVSAATIAGHMFTIFLNFKGGKGVATGLGVFLALMPLPSLIAFVIFGLVFLFSGYVSLSSMLAVASLPLAAYFSGYDIELIIFSFATAMLIIYKHRSNIARLRKGTESKFKIFKR